MAPLNSGKKRLVPLIRREYYLRNAELNPLNAEAFLGVASVDWKIVFGKRKPEPDGQAFLIEEGMKYLDIALPCNIVVQETAGGDIEVSAVDPVALMQAIQNPALARTAEEVRTKLKRVIESLSTE